MFCFLSETLTHIFIFISLHTHSPHHTTHRHNNMRQDIIWRLAAGGLGVCVCESTFCMDIKQENGFFFSGGALSLNDTCTT